MCSTSIYKNSAALVMQVLVAAFFAIPHSASAIETGDLQLTAGSSTTVTVGSSVTYSFTVTNTSNSLSEFFFNNMLVPAGHTLTGTTGVTGCTVNGASLIQCDMASITANGTATHTFTFATASPAACGSVNFNGEVTIWEGEDINSGNNTATASATINCPSSSSSSSAAGDLQIAAGVAGAATAGDIVTYTYTVTNTATTATTFNFQDITVPAGHTLIGVSGPVTGCTVVSNQVQCDAVTVAGSSTNTIGFNFNTVAPTACATVNLSATMGTIVGTNVNTTNDTASTEAIVTCPSSSSSSSSSFSSFSSSFSSSSSSSTSSVPNTRDLQLTVSTLPSNPVEGSTVVVTYTLTNLGAQDASNVTVDIDVLGLVLQSSTPATGTFDGTTWTIPTLNNTEVTTLQLVYLVPITGTVQTYELSAFADNRTENDPELDNNTADTIITSQLAIITSGGGGGGGGGGTRSGGAPSTSFTAPAAFGGTDSTETCLEFTERPAPIFNDIADSSFNDLISLWGQTTIKATGEAPITGYNNHSAVAGTTVVNFNPALTLNRMQAAKIILVSHCISIPATIPVPENGFAFADLPTTLTAENSSEADFFTARVMYTAYAHGIVKGANGTTANAYQNITVAEALAMLLRIDQTSLTDGTDVWYAPYVDFAKAHGMTVPTNVNATIKRDAFIKLLTDSINNGVFTDIARYIADHML